MHDARHDPSQPLDIYRIASPDALHPLTDIESLRLDNDSLREQIAVLSRQQAAILATLARHADVLQNIVLGGGA
jgi:hypothetical protein